MHHVSCRSDGSLETHVNADRLSHSSGQRFVAATRVRCDGDHAPAPRQTGTSRLQSGRAKLRWIASSCLRRTQRGGSCGFWAAGARGITSQSCDVRASDPQVASSHMREYARHLKTPGFVSILMPCCGFVQFLWSEEISPDSALV